MDFEKRLEEIRSEINSMSKKVIKLRADYKSLKRSYLLSTEKKETVKKQRRKRESKRMNQVMENFEKFAQIKTD